MTREAIKEIVYEQELHYDMALDELMSKKKSYIKNLNLFTSEIFSLKKIISINKRAGNTYAVLRDEVKVKSYRIIRSQNMLIKSVLIALDLPDRETFLEALNSNVTQNQLEVQKITSVSYLDKLSIDASSKTLIKAKENIREFYALKEINIDMVNNIYKLEKRMYRLNKYSKYHLINAVVFINALPVVQVINPMLELYGLTVIKILFILSLFILIYTFRKFVFVAL